MRIHKVNYNSQGNLTKRLGRQVLDRVIFSYQIDFKSNFKSNRTGFR